MASLGTETFLISLNAVYEVGNEPLLCEVSHGEPKCMEAFHGTSWNSSYLVFHC